jgi:hypothetical protein
MTKAKTSVQASKEAPARAHKLDSSNPKLTYIGGSKFDAWNGTVANQDCRPLGMATIRMRIDPTSCNQLASAFSPASNQRTNLREC